MRIPVPDEIPPADRLGRVHFVGIGGAGAVRASPGSCRRAASPVSGSDGTDSPTLAALRELGATCHLGHDAAHVDDVDTARRLHRRPRRQPRVAEASGAGCGCCRARPALAVGDGRPPGRRRRRHARQDHHHALLTVALQRGRRRPVVRDRRRPGRHRRQRRRRHRRPVRRRGRRERRRLPGLRAARRDRHQRRRRPPRQLGHRGGLRRGLRRLRRPIDPVGFLVCCVDDPGAAALAEPGARRRAPGRHGGGVGRRRPARRRSRARRPTSTFPVCATAPTWATSPCRPGSPLRRRRRSPPWPLGLRLGLRPDAWPRARRATPAPAAGWSARARRRASASTTATPTTPPRSAATSQAARALAGEGRLVVGVPAPPRLPHPHLRRRDGRRARRRRRGRRARPLPRPRGPRPRGHRRASSPTPSRSRPSRSPRRRRCADVAASCSPPGPRPGDLVLTLGAGDVTQRRARRCSPCSGARA